MKELVSSGDIMRMFKKGDPKTIVRRPNIRRFTQASGVRYYVLEGKWLIDYKEFFQKVNPRNIKKEERLPRIRCKADCLELFSKEYPLYLIDKHIIDLCVESASVTRYHHGNRWFVNYDELVPVILHYLEMGELKDDGKLQPNYSKLWKMAEENELSDLELAKRTGIPPSAVVRMRQGKTVSMKWLFAICETFRCNISDILSVKSSI